MSIRVLQYLPGFVEGDPIDTTVEKLEDILELDFVKRWTENHSLGVSKFDAIPKYGIQEYCYIYANVFNENLKANQQWVVAFVYQPYDLVKETLSGLKEFS